jgi:pectate lyase
MRKIFLTGLISLLIVTNSWSQQLAFPTAEGYGKYTVGGRGGDVYEVTNLNDSGEGSLRAALEAEGPRTVVFRLSGTITGNYSMKNDSITIAGQTAPGDGICIRGNLSTGADNIIIRYIRVRWDPALGAKDALGGRYHKNIIFDHVSASWSTDETLTLYHNENTTVQWCIIAQACPKGTTDEHRFGGIWGNNYGTWHHNLIAHNASRNPRWASGCGFNDYRNNVIYNWEYASSYGGEAHQKGDRRKPPIEHSTINMIANYYKPGPATESKVRSRITAPSSRNGDADAGKWWVSDNFVEGYPAVTSNNLLGVTKTSSAYILNEPWPAMKIDQETAEEAYQSVLEKAGCSFPKRDKVDAEIIDDVLYGTAKYGNKGIIDNPGDVGGWPELKSTPAPIDTDHDGMPDKWEIQNGLNPKDATDKNKVADDGYTMLEKYLNSIF